MVRSISTIHSIRPYRSTDVRLPACAFALLIACLAAFARPSAAADPDADASRYLQLFVTEPYLELHLGPGRAYPVTQVVPLVSCGAQPGTSLSFAAVARSVIVIVHDSIVAFAPACTANP